jgi:hypothetical protein
MAKKSRRARKKKPRSVSRAPVVSAAETAAPEAAVEAPAEPEYAYVVADMRHVALLAAAMFALLIALSFFIR